MNFDDPLIAGDTWDWTTAVDGYPATGGWTLKYYLTPRVAGTQILLSASTASDGTSYRVQVSPAASAAFASGRYDWRARVEKTGAEVTVDQGSVIIQAKVAGLTSSDNRSYARQMLDQIEPALLAFNMGVKSYSIGSRTMTKRDTPELLTMRDRFRTEVQNEIAAAKIADGQANPRTFGVRFKRV
ncbi:MAG TPA: hypothetical protein VK583_08080 [Burkholderiales bacterium]|nr:hypothetical protein [Burkholderiales bacterium]